MKKTKKREKKRHEENKKTQKKMHEEKIQMKQGKTTG